MTIAAVLTIIVFGGVALASGRTQAMLSTHETALELDGKLARTSVALTQRLLAANSQGLTPDLTVVAGLPTPWTSELRFRVAEGWGGSAIDWGPEQVLRWELDPGETNDGTDEDADGLIDEGRIVWIEDEGGADERRATLVTGVAELLEGELPNALDDDGDGLVDEAGFCVTLEGDVLVVRFTLLQQPGDGGAVVVRTRELRVRPRNTGG